MISMRVFTIRVSTRIPASNFNYLLYVQSVFCKQQFAVLTKDYRRGSIFLKHCLTFSILRQNNTMYQSSSICKLSSYICNLSLLLPALLVCLVFVLFPLVQFLINEILNLKYERLLCFLKQRHRNLGTSSSFKKHILCKGYNEDLIYTLSVNVRKYELYDVLKSYIQAFVAFNQIQ